MWRDGAGMKDGCRCIVNGFKAKALPPPPSSPAAADKVTCHNIMEAGSQTKPDAGRENTQNRTRKIWGIAGICSMNAQNTRPRGAKGSPAPESSPRHLKEKNQRIPGTLGWHMNSQVFFKWCCEVSDLELSGHWISFTFNEPWGGRLDVFPVKVGEKQQLLNLTALSQKSYMHVRLWAVPESRPPRAAALTPNSCTCLCSERQPSEPSLHYYQSLCCFPLLKPVAACIDLI